MPMNNAEELLDKYSKGLCTAEEIAILETWYLKLQTRPDGLPDEELEVVLSEIAGRLPLVSGESRTYNLWPKIMVAAAITFVIAFSVYFFTGRRLSQQNIIAHHQQQISPGSNKAILTLASGKQIILDAAANGKLVQQSDITIIKTADGQIRYEAAHDGEAKKANSYNLMTTPRGGQYHLILADGTAIWLNAASSIKYPETFNGKYRDVSITGEAYFEVAKDKSHPFRVQSGSQQIEVLGTHFNVNAYTDEALTKTSLLEGVVKVSTATGKLLLKPGQQAQVNAKGIAAVDLKGADVIAWKNGLFNFNKADIESVMRQFSRWYDIKVIYQGSIPEVRITGKVHKDADLSKALEILSYLDIHYSIRDRTLTIKP